MAGTETGPQSAGKSAPTGERFDATLFAVLGLGVFSFALLQSLVIPPLPLFASTLHTSQNAVTWVITSYLLSASIFTPLLGRLGDLVGKRTVLIASLTALAAGCVVAAVASTIGVLVAARALQGVGGAVVPLAFGIIRDEYDSQRVAGLVGTMAALAAMGGGAGVVLAGPIVDGFGFRWIFWLPALTVSIAAAAAVAVVPRPRVSTKVGPLPWTSAALLSLSMVAVLAALTDAPTSGWVTWRTVALLLVSAAAGVGWWQSEVASSSPLVDVTVLRLRVVLMANVVSFLIGFALYAVLAFLPQFVEAPRAGGYGFGATISEAGVILLPFTVTMFVAGLIAARATRRFGAALVLSASTSVAAAALALLATTHDREALVLASTGVLGLGVGASFAVLSSLVVSAVPPGRTSVAVAMNANVRTLGGCVGAAVMSSIVASHPGQYGPAESGFVLGFTMLAGVLVVAAVASWRLRIVPANAPAQSDVAAVLDA